MAWPGALGQICPAASPGLLLGQQVLLVDRERDDGQVVEAGGDVMDPHPDHARLGLEDVRVRYLLGPRADNRLRPRLAVILRKRNGQSIAALGRVHGIIPGHDQSATGQAGDVAGRAGSLSRSPLIPPPQAPTEPLCHNHWDPKRGWRGGTSQAALGVAHKD